MNRWSLLFTPVKSSESQRFFTTAAAKLPVSRFQKTLSFTSHNLFSPPKFPVFTTSAAKTGKSIRPDPIPLAMEPSSTESSDPLPGGEDYIHIENPNPKTDSLSESIVNVADELREDGANDANETVSASDGGDTGRKELPRELSSSVTVLSCESTAENGTCDVYLVGTAHVSQESCIEVQAVINSLKPQVVFLELCSSRVAVLTPQNLKVPTMAEMIEMWKKNHNLFGILYSWFLAKVANKLEVFPGSEFRVAFEEARKYGAKVILGDRPVQITLRRTWDKMPLWHKAKLVYSLLFQAVFLPSPEDLNKMLKEMDDVDMLTLVIQEMSKEFPTLMETLVHERDQYMSSMLVRAAREHTSVVAVVGKGHLQGIKKHWRQPVVMKDLLELPSRKPAFSVAKALASVGVAVASVAIISGIYLGYRK
uniref:TraB domain-containing protein-like n=2 Tax=Rhizophora mucronata TaxID=61149 RepID=A0A2P2K0H0_RHIMU